MIAIDLFCGLGWDEAARELGIEPLGIDLDADVCETREARGLRTLKADVGTLDPMDFAPVELLIASPPCTAFSTAGKSIGRAALPTYAEMIRRMAAGEPIDRDAADAACDDATAHLVLEPLRWALALRPAAAGEGNPLGTNRKCRMTPGHQSGYPISRYPELFNETKETQ